MGDLKVLPARHDYGELRDQLREVQGLREVIAGDQRQEVQGLREAIAGNQRQEVQVLREAIAGELGALEAA